MTLTQHSVLSAAGAGAAAVADADAPSCAAFFVMGVFIDLDHVLEYWIQVAFPTPRRLKHFFYWFDKKQSQKLWIFLHAWEWIALGAVLAFWLGAPAWVWWGLGGWLFHMTLDQFSNGMHPLGYFMAFRAAKGFDGPSIGMYPGRRP